MSESSPCEWCSVVHDVDARLKCHLDRLAEAGWKDEVDELMRSSWMRGAARMRLSAAQVCLSKEMSADDTSATTDAGVVHDLRRNISELDITDGLDKGIV